MKFVISLFFSTVLFVSLYATELEYAHMGILNDGIANTKGKDYSVAFEILIREISAKKRYDR